MGEEVIDDKFKGLPGIETLTVRIIPKALICKDLITDFEDKPLYAYEDWVRELINCSESFLQMSDGHPYEASISEAHGECDAISSCYEIDFKLILGQSMQQAIRETSPQCITGNGMTLFCNGRSSKTFKAVYLHTALRGLNKETLSCIAKGTYTGSEDKEILKDVRKYLKSIRRNKNMLLILPYLFGSSDGASVDQYTIIQCLNRELVESLSLRHDWYPSRDTFVAYFYDGNMEILRFSQVAFSQFDSVSVTKSPTFLKIVNQSTLSPSSHLDALLGRRL